MSINLVVLIVLHDHCGILALIWMCVAVNSHRITCVVRSDRGHFELAQRMNGHVHVLVALALIAAPNNSGATAVNKHNLICFLTLRTNITNWQ